jgi:uncharacterized damage-inducible protein DinB
MSKNLLIDSIDRAFKRGEGLWAESLLDTLKGINFEQAIWKPKENVKSIFEIVNHVISGKEYIISALEGRTPSYEEEKKEISESSWKETLEKLEEVHNKLINLLKEKDINLEEKFPGEDFTWGYMLYGVLAHDCYHTGQIVILKDLQGLG